ncbi:ribosomal protection-like ABC-F family protein [Lachnobacterium bovis]|uniref:ATP-binding cassette, subfamily F, member 3 n=1 Tax=Lachnobacterium bovis TaxID=140626 RepID=A0A1H9R6Q4_9FIRM|nr:ABC-F type ribosomal protection protein [Lachnobacterium bovis]SER68406.1 ATP-binding cassette, subfamily F, member 3 [Lachnobacterium bovis]
MLYQVSNGSISYGDEPIVSDIVFEVKNTEKIAIVGRNGCGKTTFLKAISGELDFESQSENKPVNVAKTGNPTIGYLKQISFEDTTITLEEEVKKVFKDMDFRKKELAEMAKKLEEDYSDSNVKTYIAMEEKFREDGGYYYEKEYDVLIRKFGFTDEERKKTLDEFSGGQQTKIAFIKLLLSKPDILLLDEPTNHLDVTTIQWLENYLKNYEKAVIVVSHDRMFLDNVVDVVYEIEYSKLTKYPGNYSYFVEQKEKNYEKQLKDYENQQKEIKRLQELVEKMKHHPTKVSMAWSKQKAIDRMKKIPKPEKFNTKTFKSNFKPKNQSGNDVLFINNMQIGYDNQVLSEVSLDLKRGQKLGIIGANGLGKSTFLKTIAGKIEQISGEYKYGAKVEIGYFDQQMAMYRSSKNILNDFWDEFPNLTEQDVRSSLGAFLFSGDDVYKDVNMLSGGEKVRLALCKLMKRRPNVLILDEPTNHMDIVGKETLEKMLQEFEGTVIFVSHDRYFMKRVATKILLFENGYTRQFQFGYDEYQEKIAEEENEEISSSKINGIKTFGKIGTQNVTNSSNARESKAEKSTKTLVTVTNNTTSNNSGTTIDATSLIGNDSASTNASSIINDVTSTNTLSISNDVASTNASSISNDVMPTNTSSASNNVTPTNTLSISNDVTPTNTSSASNNASNSIKKLTKAELGVSDYELGKMHSRLRRQLKDIESEIEKLEQQGEALQEELLNPEYQSMYSKLTEIQEQIDENEMLLLEKMEEWENVNNEKESLPEL